MNKYKFKNRLRRKIIQEFSDKLLMPEEAFIKQWLIFNCIRKVSDYFGVTEDMAKYRAFDLGLINTL